MRYSPPCRFCKQKLLKYHLVSTVSVYNKSDRKKETQIDYFNYNYVTGWLIEDNALSKVWLFKRITPLFISDPELSSVCAETAKTPRVFELKTQTEAWKLALDDIDHSYYIRCNLILTDGIWLIPLEYWA